MLSGSSYIPPFYFYQFADAISAPYTSLKAYQGGVIDANGNLLKSENNIEPFEYLVIKLKKIFEQLPYGMTKAKLGGYLSTLQLFAEEAEAYNFNSEYMHALIEGHISNITDGEISYLELCEDMGSGGGAAGSLGTPMGGSGDTPGVAGYDPPLTDKIIKRKYLQNCEIFDVCPEDYVAFKNAKSWKNIPDGPTKNYMQRFQRRNKGTKLAVRTTMPESGEQDLYWITYPSKSFMEEYGLKNVDFLTEGMEYLNEALSPKEVHDKFATYLIKKGYVRVPSPDLKTRQNAESLQKFHDSLPHGHFYVGENPNEGRGHDAYLKVDNETYGGIELKKSTASKPRSKKPSHHGMGIGISRILLDKLAKRYGKESEVEKKPSLVKKIFSGLMDSSKLQKLVERGAQKEIERRGELIIAGDVGGVHAVSSSRRKSSENNRSELYDRHQRLASSIGMDLTGNIKDWGGTLQTGFKKSRPTSETDKGVSLKTRVELTPVSADHEMHGSYVRNSEFLK
jgi:hypothetical protein